MFWQRLCPQLSPPNPRWEDVSALVQHPPFPQGLCPPGPSHCERTGTHISDPLVPTEGRELLDTVKHASIRCLFTNAESLQTNIPSYYVDFT